MNSLLASFPEVEDRELWDNYEPDGYMESDSDFVIHNMEAAVWFLENAETIKKLLDKQ